MSKSVDETLLPRPPQVLDTPAMAQAVRRAAERLEEQFRLSSDAATAFATAVVDPSDIRKAAEKPEELYVPGGTLFGLRTRVWERRAMPDPRNPRVGPARRHPAAVPPGSTEDSRFRPIPEPDPNSDGRPELELRLQNREHLSLGIRDRQVHPQRQRLALVDPQSGRDDRGLAVGSNPHARGRHGAGHGTHHIRGQQPTDSGPRHPRHSLSRRALLPRRSIPPLDHPEPERRVQQWSVGRTSRGAAMRDPACAPPRRIRAESRLDDDLRRRRAVAGCASPTSTHQREWDPAATIGSIADFVLETLAADGLITPDEELWLAGGLTPQEAEACGLSADPAVRAARIVRLLTDDDPSIQFAVRVAIASQSTRKRITNKFKLQVAAALIMRSVTAADERGKVTDIHRALRDGFSDTLATQSWYATYRPTADVVAAAIEEVSSGRDRGPNSLELAAMPRTHSSCPDSSCRTQDAEQ